jgi:hypothetical protein
MGNLNRNIPLMINIHKKIYGTTADLAIFNIVLLKNTAVDQNLYAFTTVRAFYFFGDQSFIHKVRTCN